MEFCILSMGTAVAVRMGAPDRVLGSEQVAPLMRKAGLKELLHRLSQLHWYHMSLDPLTCFSNKKDEIVHCLVSNLVNLVKSRNAR